jgi:hypothetical protein
VRGPQTHRSGVKWKRRNSPHCAGRKRGTHVDKNYQMAGGWTASVEKPGDLKALSKEKTALHLLRCRDDEANDLRAMLGVENADLSRQLAVVRAPSSMAVLMRRQEIVRGALQGFENK